MQSQKKFGVCHARSRPRALLTSSVTNKFASKCATIWPKCAQKCATEEFGQNVLKNAPQKFFYCIFMHQFF